jgi:hypothetical protein
LLLFDEGVQRTLGRFLRFEELLVERCGLLLHALERGKALLRHQQRLAQGVGVGIRHHGSHVGGAGAHVGGWAVPISSRVQFIAAGLPIQ